MPHCIIEYAAPLENIIDISKLVDEVFRAADETGLFDTASIKVRALPFTSFKAGADQQLYVSTIVKLLPGRTQQQKETLGKTVLASKQTLLEGKALFFVEVVDISASYFK